MAISTYDNFRALLRAAIGSTAQAEFAKKTGLSAEHLNRMLNAKEIHRPSKQTLISIAENAANGITYQDLVDVLDNAESDSKFNSTAKKSVVQSFEETANEVFKTVKLAIKSLLPEGRVVKVSDLNDFMVMIERRYNNLKDVNIDISYDIEVARKYFGSVHNDVTHYAFVNLNIVSNYNSASGMIILYFSYLAKSDDVIIQYADMDLESIVDLIGYPPFLMAKYKDKDKEQALEEIIKLPYLIEIKSTKQWSPNAGKKLLDFIFNEDTIPSEYEAITINGFGFHIDDVPPNFNTFVKNHMSSIFEGKEHFYAAMMSKAYELDLIKADSNAFAQIFEKYYDEFSCEDGWRAVISSVMRRETNFAFNLYEKTDDKDVLAVLPDLSDGHVILVTDQYISYRHISSDTIVSVVGRYAAELGLETFGDIEFCDWNFKEVRKPRVYRVDKSEISEEETDAKWVSFETFVPPSTGIYNVLLKDGREMRMMYLADAKIKSEDRGVWLLFHKCWNNMIESYDATGPIVPDKDKKDEM